MAEAKSKAYWERRSADRMEQYQKGADATIRAIRKAYAEASGSLLSSVNALFERYACAGKLEKIGRKNAGGNCETRHEGARKCSFSEISHHKHAGYARTGGGRLCLS